MRAAHANRSLNPKMNMHIRINFLLYPYNGLADYLAEIREKKKHFVCIQPVFLVHVTHVQIDCTALK